jgi:hypothetical protein
MKIINLGFSIVYFILPLRSLRFFAFSAVLVLQMVVKAGARGNEEVAKK